MSAPQGSGKTTICEELQNLLAEEGFHGVFASLDDFYLPFEGQQALAKVGLLTHCRILEANHSRACDDNICGHNVCIQADKC